MLALFHAVLWNSGSALILALAVFVLGLIPAIHRRPTLLHLLWFGVLLRLAAPSVVPVPILPGLPTTVSMESENADLPPQSVSVTIASAPTPAPIPEAVSVPRSVSVAPSVTVQPVVRPVPQWHVSTLLIIAPLTGTTLMCLLCLYRLRRIRRLLRVAQDPPARLVELVEATADAWGISRSPRVRLVDGLASPAVWIGWRRATILLPRHLLNSLDDDQWSCILSHELAHLVRRDHWFNFFGSIVLHLYWWNPVAWWAWREMLANQEASCDAAAISQNSTSRRLYAETLLQVVESWNGRSVFQPRVLLGFGNRSVLTRRFEMIADASVHPRIAAVTMIVLVLGALSFVCMPVRASMTDPAVAAPEKPANDDSRKAVQAVDPPRSAPRTAQRRGATFYELVRKGFLGDRGGGIFWVAANRVVQGEIGLDAAATATVDGIVEQYARERSAASDQMEKQLRELGDLTEDDRKKRRTAADEKFEGDIKQMTEKSMTQLKAVFSAEQFSRLQQIAWQAYGSEALATDRVLAKELKLMEDQIKKTAALNEEYLTKQRELFRAGMLDDEKLQKERDRKAIELLTMDQQKTLAKLKGKPFDVALLMDPPDPRQQFSYYKRIFSIVKNEAVQKEGGFDAAAVGNVDRIVAQYDRELDAANIRMSQATPVFRPPDGPSLAMADVKKWRMAWFEQREEFYREANAIRDKFATQLKAALTSAQFDRLRQIAWQENETEALAYDEELAAALGLKPGQIDKIIAVNQDGVRKLRRLSDGSMDKRLQLEKDRDNKAIQTLTPGQQEAFAKLKGKPFVVAQLRNQPAELDFGGDTYIVAPHGGIFPLASVIWKELGLSVEAEAKAIAVNDQFNAAWRQAGVNAAWRQAMSGLRLRTVVRPGGGSRSYHEAVPPWGLCFEQSQSNEERNEAIAGMMEKWHATTSKFLPQLKEVLTADQFVRLQQIHRQALDTFAYSDPEVIEALAITNEQRERINAIANDYRARKQELFVQGGDGVREKINELAKEKDEKINDVLTKAQLEKFAAMKGKEFDVNQLLDATPVRTQGGRRPR